MLPYITFFNKTINVYAIIAAIGIIICGVYLTKQSKKRNIDDSEIVILGLISLIGVFIGSHLLYFFTQLDLFKIFITHLNKVTSFDFLIKCLYELFGGSVFYGGLIGGLIASYIYIKKKKFNIKETYDLVTPAIPLFHCFGRIGCFLSGCCYGIESKIGFTYTHAIVESANNVNRFPIQLVESFLNLLIFIVLNNLNKKEKHKGKILYYYLLIYPTIRFILEFFRGDYYRGFLFGLSTSQIISIILIIFSIFKLKKLCKKA